MVGASRCIAATLSKFGGPQTLPQATPSLCVPTPDSGFWARASEWISADNVLVQRAIRSIKNTSKVKSEKNFLRLREVAHGVRAHVQGREATALFAAAG